jgi:HK97 gp10 family phage protein
MPDTIQFSIRGVAELATALESKPPIVARQIIRESLRKSVEPWREEMAARVRRGWHVFSRTKVKGQRRSFAGRSREYGVIAKSILIRSQIGASGFDGVASVSPSKRGFWARFLEFHTRKMPAYPFIVPAFESRKGDVLAAYIADLRYQLHREMGLS